MQYPQDTGVSGGKVNNRRHRWHCIYIARYIYKCGTRTGRGDNIQSKVMTFAFGLSAEIERVLIRQRTKEALMRLKKTR